MKEDNRSFEQFLEEGAPSLELTEYDQHPSEEMLISYVYDQLENTIQPRISAHIATCPSCHKKIQKLRDERKEVENQLAPFLFDPLQMEIKVGEGEEKASWIGRLKENMDNFLQKVIFPHRRAIYAHIGAYALVAALLFGVNALLDHFLVPPPSSPDLAPKGTPSPLASPSSQDSPSKLTKWWTYSYWLLLPWGVFLIGRIIYTLTAKRKPQSEEGSDGKSGS